MNTNIKRSTKVLASLFVVLLSSLLATKTLAQGPNAPEAASFEPVDATDMVNLVTGDLSYVLPLLNVPSPEGGYPIALSYHSGIAMDQEASWVGLGWNLNPGTINRGVNGYPDDWGKTNVSEFFYDLGFEEEFYSFGTGVTFGGGVSVGLGLSWGSNRSLGGHVSANLGLGDGTNNIAGIGGSIGTEGVSLNAGINVNGVGIGYGSNARNSVLGISLNYNYNSGLSGGLSVRSSNGNFNSRNSKASGTGIDFSSSSNSYNNSSNGIGISNTSYSVTSNDYQTTVSSSGFYLPVYMFYVNFNKTRVKNSLFKLNNLYVSGILNPILANKTDDFELNDTSAKMLENHFMDVNVMPRVEGLLDFNKILNNDDKIEVNNLILPNYDNYTVTAQGLSGSISPYLIDELNLSSRGKSEQNGDNLYEQYLDYDIAYYMSAPSTGTPSNRDFLNKVHFTFDSYYNSFLRFDKTNIQNDNLSSSVNDLIALEYYNTANSYNYTESFLVGRKKKEGNYITTFTNKEIRESYAGGVTKSSLPNFVDAREFNNQNVNVKLDRSNPQVFLDEGIGAYSITSVDGKTYHYSLPVYQFESFYKNFKDKNDENKNFFEIRKTTPYATHWLLTAITGPDYVDVNDNGRLDEDDYGFWVEFDYGKWSDGYIWQTPNGRFEEINNGGDEKTYSYSWGRKQIYYLDAIKTRTHTALFVKSLRDDNLSVNKQINSGQVWNSGQFDLTTYGQKFESQRPTIQHPIFLAGTPGDVLYTVQGNPVSLPAIYSHDPPGGGSPQTLRPYKYSSRKVLRYLYTDIPQSRTLKLDKIVLLKNDNFDYDFKKTGALTNNLIGKIAYNTFYDLVSAYHGNQGLYASYLDHQYLRKHPNFIRSFDSNIHENVLDVADIANMNLMEEALQVIDFNYNYSLAKESPNSVAGSNGRLALNNIYFKGKKGTSLLPPYKFNYNAGSFAYNSEDIDNWGYHKLSPELWSLNQITVPTGASLRINYESDDYYEEAVESSRIFTDGLMHFITATSASSDVYIDITNDLDPNTETIDDFTDFFEVGDQTLMKLFICRRENYGNSRREVRLVLDDSTVEVIEVTATNVKIRVPFNEVMWYFDDQDQGWIVNRDWSKYGVYDSNGVHDGVIIRNTTSDVCHEWRYPYENSDVSINYKLYGSESLKDQKGGGIRVKDLIVSNYNNLNFKTSYYYNNPSYDKDPNNVNYKSSGITSYAPSDNVKAIPYISELPAPSVLYSNVTMETYDTNDNLLGGQKFVFSTFKQVPNGPGEMYNVGDVLKVRETQNDLFTNGQVVANKFEIESRLSKIGQLVSSSSYNAVNQIISSRINEYKTDLDGDLEVGVSQESFKSSKRVLSGSSLDEKFYVSSTSKIRYPSPLIKTSVIKNNFTNSEYFDKHDLLTGRVLETRTYDSKGNAFKTELIPAYTIFEYSEMGSKVDDGSNKNMLTQEAANYTYLLDEINNTQKILDANITTWNNIWSYRDHTGYQPDASTEMPVWRQHKNYVWQGEVDEQDGTYIDFIGEDDGFIWGLGDTQTNSKWRDISTTTRYDHYSAPLETKDINDNYASTKLGDGDSKVLAVANAKYKEMYYSGAEYLAGDGSYFDGEIKSFGWRPDTEAHTGYNSVRIAAGEKAFEVSVPADDDRTDPAKQRFKVSVWVRKGGEDRTRIEVGGVADNFTPSEKVYAGNWVQLNGYINIPASQTTVAIIASSNTIDLDDFRLHPITTVMRSYVYNKWDELWYLIDSNGLATKYEYDATGKLTNTYVEIEDDGTSTSTGFKLISKNKYNYQR